MTINSEFVNPHRTIRGTALARAGEAVRAHAAAEWVAGRLAIDKPTLSQASLVFHVPPSTVKAALERAGDRPRRAYRKKPSSTTMPVLNTVGVDLRLLPAGVLSIDQLLELAASIESTSVKTNGSAIHSV